MAEEDRDRSRSRSRERDTEAPAAEGAPNHENSDLRVYVGNLKFEVRYFILFFANCLTSFNLFFDRLMIMILKSFFQNMVTLLRQKLFALETIQVKVKDLVLSHLLQQKVQPTP